MSSEERNYGSQNHQKCNQGDKHCVRNRSTQHPKGGVTGSWVPRMVAVVMKGTEAPNPRRSSAFDSGMRMLRQPGRAR